MPLTSGSFKKGYDPRRNSALYRVGDGKKRKPFVKGDPRRSDEHLHENFQRGNIAAHNEDGPKVTAKARADLIPAEHQVVVSPEQTGMELLPMLHDAIECGMRMKGAIEENSNVRNNLDGGLWTVLLTKCIKTRAAIEGEGLEPAAFGTLSAEAVEVMKQQLADLLQCDLTKFRYGFFYSANHDIFDKNGQVLNWAGRGMRERLAAIRATIELRARLDLWERTKDHKLDALEVAYMES